MHYSSYWMLHANKLFFLCPQILIAPSGEQQDNAVVLDFTVTLPDSTDSQTLDDFEVREISHMCFHGCPQPACSSCISLLVWTRACCIQNLL